MKDIQISLLKAKSCYLRAEESRQELLCLIEAKYGVTGIKEHIDNYLLGGEITAFDIMTFLENFSRKC